MRGEEYVQRIVQELDVDDNAHVEMGMSFLSALEMMAEVETPLKEEALVRLVVLGMGRAPQGAVRQRACA
jgi:hypothetical protein